MKLSHNIVIIKLHMEKYVLLCGCGRNYVSDLSLGYRLF